MDGSAGSSVASTHLHPKRAQQQHASRFSPGASHEPSLHSNEDPDRTAWNGTISATQETASAKPRDYSLVKGLLRRDGLLGEGMEVLIGRHSAKTRTSSHASSAMSSVHLPIRPNTTTSEKLGRAVLNGPFELRHGRRYLRDADYPLPVDLAELNRQVLRTLLAVEAFGGVICSPVFEKGKEVPKRVLEIGCGSAFWSATCHEHYAALGYEDIEFTGIDIAPLAPDLKKQGVNWKFVEHDVRKVPWPFEHEYFDMVMAKDLSLVMPLALESESVLAEMVKFIRPGGVLEVWDGDHVIRSLHPNMPMASRKKTQEQSIADQTATFSIPPGHPFLPTQSKHLQQANAWMMQSLFARGLHPMPCVRIAEIMLQEDALEGFGARRVAIPLGGFREERAQWEGWKEQSLRSGNSTPSVRSMHSGDGSPNPGGLSAGGPIVTGHDSPMCNGLTDPLKIIKPLTADQAALRQTALITVLQFIQGMEPLLKEASGKNSDEWHNWCSSMMTDLLDPSQAGLSGECLELGVWWTQKVASSS